MSYAGLRHTRQSCAAIGASVRATRIVTASMRVEIGERRRLVKLASVPAPAPPVELPASPPSLAKQGYILRYRYRRPLI